MTAGACAHLIPDENRQAVKRLDDPGWKNTPAERTKVMLFASILRPVFGQIMGVREDDDK